MYHTFTAPSGLWENDSFDNWISETNWSILGDNSGTRCNSEGNRLYMGRGLSILRGSDKANKRFWSRTYNAIVFASIFSGTLNSIMFHGILRNMHQNQPSYNKLQQREYILEDEDNGLALVNKDNWSSSIRPGMILGLSIVLREAIRESALAHRRQNCSKCYQICKHPTLSGIWLKW